MEKNKLVEAIKQAKANAKKLNFTQSIDVVINLKDLANNEKIEEIVTLPNKSSKSPKVCAPVGGELDNEAKLTCDKHILNDEFSNYDKRAPKKLARQYDYFIAQATVMAQIAQAFGKFLAPVKKMPNPKFGQIVPPKAKLKPLVDKLKSSIILRTIKSPVIQARIGDEKMTDEAIADNAKVAIDTVISKLPNAAGNIKNVLIKTTMGKPARVK